MGRMTRDELIEAAQGMVGNRSSALTARLATRFQPWLDRQYAAWAWPFLRKRAVGLSLSSGATSLSVGNGSGGVSTRISRLISPIIVYTANKTVRRKSPIVGSINTSESYDETLADSSTFRGVPTQFKTRHGSTSGAWDLIPLPFPDRSLLLAVDYYEIPVVLGGSDIPIYPADETLIEALIAMAAEDQYGASHPNTITKIDSASGKLAYDRSTYGSSEGENDVMYLDPYVFGSRGSDNTGGCSGGSTSGGLF